MNPTRLLIRVIRTAALVAVAASLLLLGCQSRMIYFQRAYEAEEVSAFLARGGVELEYETRQGRQRAFFRPGPAAEARLWLFCPGNAMLALEAADESRRWDPEAGWLFVDYPGYGGNAGKPNPATVAENVTGAVHALATHLGTTPAALAPRLGAAGQSLGAAAALTAAEVLSLDRVVVLSPFTTLTEMGRLSVGWPLCQLNRHRYDNRRPLAAAAARGGRVWIVHGIDDEIIPVRMARELASLAPSAVRLVEVPGARHNDLWDVAPEVLRRVFHEAAGR